jgi:hypothetical protein
MTAPRLSQLPQAAQAAVRARLAAQGIEVGQPREKVAKRAVDPTWWKGNEGDLQRAVNAMLRGRGYWPRDKGHILQDGSGRRGWCFHMPRAMGNPFVLDLVLFDRRGRCLEFELKTATGPTSPIQQAIIESDDCKVARSVAEAEAIVTAWEGLNVPSDRAMS